MTLNAGERDFSQETSAGVRSLGIGSSTDSTWCLLPTQVPSNPMFKTKNEPQFLGGVSELTIDSTMPKQRQQHCFFGSEIDSPGALKQEQHSIRPFLSEWPTTTKESWSNLENDGSNQNAFSTTQLSISIPVPPSSFSSRSDCSQNGESKPELIKTYQSGFWYRANLLSHKISNLDFLLIRIGCRCLNRNLDAAITSKVRVDVIIWLLCVSSSYI